MMRGMFAAISGLKVHQMMLDVTANDIANVNTVGYKAERTSFKDALSPAPARRERARPRRSAARTRAQVGLGVQLNGIDNLMAVGRHPVDRATRSTARSRATASSGSRTIRPAFGNILYTRAGNFTRDANGDLVTPEGYYVVGYTIDPDGRSDGHRDHDQRPGRTTKSVTIGQDGIVTTIDPAGVVTPRGRHLAGEVPERRRASSASRATSSPPRTTRAPSRSAPPARTASASLTPGAVEMSNVDLAQEFTNMITAQRGFQANSRDHLHRRRDAPGAREPEALGRAGPRGGGRRGARPDPLRRSDAMIAVHRITQPDHELYLNPDLIQTDRGQPGHGHRAHERLEVRRVARRPQRSRELVREWRAGIVVASGGHTTCANVLPLRPSSSDEATGNCRSIT